MANYARDFFNFSMSLLNKNIYSIQFNLAIVPPNDSVEKVSVAAHMLKPRPFQIYLNFFVYEYKEIRAAFQRKLGSLN